MADRAPIDYGGAFAGVPLCSLERCPSYDGKRCGETGNEPGRVCVPEVRAIATARRDAEDRARMSPEGRASYDALMERYFGERRAEVEHLRAEVERLTALINTPRTDEFFGAVRLEAAHQIERWGVEHDARKGVEDWAALLVRLLGKMVDAHWNGDVAKLLHHVITIAAVAANCHASLTARLDEIGRARVAASPHTGAGQ